MPVKHAAQHRHCSARRLSELCADESPVVRRLVAQHPNTTVAGMRRCVSDADVWVRYHLAKRPDLPKDVCLRLAGDKSKRIRRVVAETQNDPTVLMVLTGDPEVAVREAARLHAWMSALSDAHQRSDD